MSRVLQFLSFLARVVVVVVVVVSLSLSLFGKRKREREKEREREKARIRSHREKRKHHTGALRCWAGEAPRAKLDRLKLIRKMVHHSQTCKSGDNTLAATRRAITDVTAKAADEYFVFVLSDADFQRYDVSSAELGNALLADERVSAYALFIASNFAAAEAIQDELPPGRGFSCYDTSKLISTLKDIFQASIILSRQTFGA